MPFNGGYKQNETIFKAKDIYKTIVDEHSSLTKLKGKHGDTATLFSIDNFQGSVGIIPAFSRTFCNTCNRLRITPKGDIKSCLYDGGVFSMRDFIRHGATDQEIADKFREIIRLKPENGFVAESQKQVNKLSKESMSTRGG